MLLGVLPIVGILFVVGAAVMIAAETIRKSSKVDWAPVWLGGEDPWGIKIYQGGRLGRGWRLEILFDGTFCFEREWRSLKLGLIHVKSFAHTWTQLHPGGCA